MATMTREELEIEQEIDLKQLDSSAEIIIWFEFPPFPKGGLGGI